MKVSLQTAFTCVFIAFLSAACQKKTQLNPGAPDWLLTYDDVGKLHQQLTSEFQTDSTRFNENERRLYHEMQKRWDKLLMVRSDMMKGPQSEYKNVNETNATGMKTAKMQNNPAAHTVSAVDSPLSEFRGKIQELLGSYESLAYLMKGMPGRAEIDTTVQQTIRTQRRLIRQISSDTSSAADLSKLISPAEIVGLYRDNCADCHGTHGEGSSDVYPPLDHTSVASRDKNALIKLVLQGLEGSVVVGGRRYDGAMPSFRASLSDEQLAVLLRYVRNMAGASDISITAGEVKRLAEETASRQGPFSPADLGIDH